MRMHNLAFQNVWRFSYSARKARVAGPGYPWKLGFEFMCLLVWQPQQLFFTKYWTFQLPFAELWLEDQSSRVKRTFGVKGNFGRVSLNSGILSVQTTDTGILSPASQRTVMHVKLLKCIFLEGVIPYYVLFFLSAYTT